MLVEPQLERRAHKAGHQRTASREFSRSLIWPWNCGSSTLAESTKLARANTSSGISFTPLGSSECSSMKLLTALNRPSRRPLVRAAGAGGDQVDVALAHRAPSSVKATHQAAPSPSAKLSSSCRRRSPRLRTAGSPGRPLSVCSGSRAGRPCRARSGCRRSSRCQRHDTPGISTALLRSRCTSSPSGSSAIRSTWRRARRAPWCPACARRRSRPCAHQRLDHVAARNTSRATWPSR
jgi:hypothetical protein